MDCLRPVAAVQDGWTKNGKKALFFDDKTIMQKVRFNKRAIMHLPCGQCDSCRMDKANQWATRGVNESYMHESSCFVTLTYAPEHLPKNWSLNKKHLSDFIKRLRSKFYRKYGKVGIRFISCGEYGSVKEGRKGQGRPHYHVILFGADFPDKRLHTTSDSGAKLYISKLLSELWPYGFHTIGEVNQKSVAYVARYSLKKLDKKSTDKYIHIYDTGEWNYVEPEFFNMSRMPGIGREFFEKYVTDFFPKDYYQLDGKKVKVPRYYYELLKKHYPSLALIVQQNREEYILSKSPEELCPSATRLTYYDAIKNKLIRGYEQKCRI